MKLRILDTVRSSLTKLANTSTAKRSGNDFVAVLDSVGKSAPPDDSRRPSVLQVTPPVEKPAVSFVARYSLPHEVPQNKVKTSEKFDPEKNVEVKASNKESPGIELDRQAGIAIRAEFVTPSISWQSQPRGEMNGATMLKTEAKPSPHASVAREGDGLNKSLISATAPGREVSGQRIGAQTRPQRQKANASLPSTVEASSMEMGSAEPRTHGRPIARSVARTLASPVRREPSAVVTLPESNAPAHGTEARTKAQLTQSNFVPGKSVPTEPKEHNTGHIAVRLHASVNRDAAPRAKAKGRGAPANIQQSVAPVRDNRPKLKSSPTGESDSAPITTTFQNGRTQSDAAILKSVDQTGAMQTSFSRTEPHTRTVHSTSDRSTVPSIRKSVRRLPAMRSSVVPKRVNATPAAMPSLPLDHVSRTRDTLTPELPKDNSTPVRDSVVRPDKTLNRSLVSAPSAPVTLEKSLQSEAKHRDRVQIDARLAGPSSTIKSRIVLSQKEETPISSPDVLQSPTDRSVTVHAIKRPDAFSFQVNAPEKGTKSVSSPASPVSKGVDLPNIRVATMNARSRSANDPVTHENVRQPEQASRSHVLDAPSSRNAVQETQRSSSAVKSSRLAPNGQGDFVESERLNSTFRYASTHRTKLDAHGRSDRAFEQHVLPDQSQITRAESLVSAKQSSGKPVKEVTPSLSEVFPIRDHTPASVASPNDSSTVRLRGSVIAGANAKIKIASTRETNRPAPLRHQETRQPKQQETGQALSELKAKPNATAPTVATPNPVARKPVEQVEKIDDKTGKSLLGDPNRPIQRETQVQFPWKRTNMQERITPMEFALRDSSKTLTMEAESSTNKPVKKVANASSLAEKSSVAEQRSTTTRSPRTTEKESNYAEFPLPKFTVDRVVTASPTSRSGSGAAKSNGFVSNQSSPTPSARIVDSLAPVVSQLSQFTLQAERIVAEVPKIAVAPPEFGLNQVKPDSQNFATIERGNAPEVLIDAQGSNPTSADLVIDKPAESKLGDKPIERVYHSGLQRGPVIKEMPLQTAPQVTPATGSVDSKTLLPIDSVKEFRSDSVREIHLNSEEHSRTRSDTILSSKSIDKQAEPQREHTAEQSGDHSTNKDARPDFRSGNSIHEPAQTTAAAPRKDAGQPIGTNEALKAALQQALDMSRRRMVDPDELRLTVPFGEFGTMDINIVRDADKFSIVIGTDPQSIVLMEDQRAQLTQWLRHQGYPVEHVNITPRFSNPSQADLTGSDRSGIDRKSKDSDRLARSIGGGSIGPDSTEINSPRPSYSGARVWTA